MAGAVLICCSTPLHFRPHMEKRRQQNILLFSTERKEGLTILLYYTYLLTKKNFTCWADIYLLRSGNHIRH